MPVEGPRMELRASSEGIIHLWIIHDQPLQAIVGIQGLEIARETSKFENRENSLRVVGRQEQGVIKILKILRRNLSIVRETVTIRGGEGSRDARPFTLCQHIIQASFIPLCYKITDKRSPRYRQNAPLINTLALITINSWICSQRISNHRLAVLRNGQDRAG